MFVRHILIKQPLTDESDTANKTQVSSTLIDFYLVKIFEKKIIHKQI